MYGVRAIWEYVMKEVEEERMAKAVVMIHDVFTKIFKLIEEINRLDIKYNIALTPRLMR